MSSNERTVQLINVFPRVINSIRHIAYFLGLIIGGLFTSQCVTAQENLPDVGVDGVQAVKSWASNRISDAESEFTYSGGLRYGSPGFWGDELVYQIFVDRFNNGDPSNDRLNIKGDQVNFQNGPDTWGIYDWRHGGDLQGIIDRLDYVSDLGVTSIWVTPIMKHDGSYHGYCTTDFTQIDPGVGSNELFREFVKQAHMRDIKVILDVVVNHMCDPQTNYSQWADRYTCADDINDKNWSGAPGGSNAQGQLGFSNNFFPPLKSQYFFNRCGANTNEDMSGTGPSAVYGDFAPSMFDFDTRNHDFQEIFTDLHKYWIAYADVDGFRLDAVKHVSEDFLAYFSTHIRDYAKSVGKDNFYLVGEVAGPADWIGRRLGKMYHDIQNPDNHGVVPATLTDRIWDVRNTYLSHGKQNFPGMSAAYDFSFSGRSRNSLRNEQWISEINNHFSDEYYLTISSQQDARLNLSSLEIHDWPRFVNGVHKGNTRKSELGLGYLATTQGIPITYYGQEQGFNGDCIYSSINAGAAYNQITANCEGHDHAAYRQDMFISGNYRLGSTVSSINDLAYIGPTQASVSPNWLDDPFLNRDHSVYQTARRFNYIRRSCNALRLGGTFPRLGWNDSDGLLAFSRINGSQEILVVVNNSGESITLPNIVVDGGINAAVGQRYINLLNGYERGIVRKDGLITTLSFGGTQISGNSVKVFVHENNTTPWDSYINAHMCTDNPVVRQQTNVPPRANAGADRTVAINQNFTLTGAASTDADGEIVNYEWSHPSFGNAFTSEEISISFDTAGVYTISLTVVDDSGASHVDEVEISVHESVDDWQRTVILIYGKTERGQDMFFRGGIDSSWSNANRGTQCESQNGGEHNELCSIQIRHLNTTHQYTLPWRTEDDYLDWGKLTSQRNGRETFQRGVNNLGEYAEGTPAIWTTNNCASGNVVSNGDIDSSCNANPNVYGGGYTALNIYGEHYWMLDVEMNCDDTVDGWFEFKSYISNGPGWETRLDQTEFGDLNPPSYASGNHFASCGRVNVYRRNQNNPLGIHGFTSSMP